MSLYEDEREKGEKARVETFVVGHIIQGGERVQWILEGRGVQGELFTAR